MAQWGNTDDAANSVLWAVSQLNKPANTTNQTALYGNTTVGAFETGEINGQYGIATNESAPGGHAGWNLKTNGTGPIIGATIVAGGSSYANTDVIKVTATGTGTVNATASITTNSSGGITTVTIVNPGAGFVNTSIGTVTASFANSSGGASGGSSANVVFTVGGRAGRVNYETLVAMGSIS